MRKFISLFTLMLLIPLTGCEKKSNETSETSIDPAEAKKEVVALMDNFHNAMKSKKADEFKDLLHEDGLFCGTDPSEIYNRNDYASYMATTLNDPNTGDIAYTVDTREIRVDDSGTTATVLEQYKMNLASPEIPWRLVSHATNDGDGWKIDFLSFSLAPTNEQSEMINRAVAKG